MKTYSVKIQFTGCEKTVEIEAETAPAAEKIAFNQLSVTEINELVDYTAAEIKTEQFLITEITADAFGYPIAKWVGNHGSQGETRLGGQGAEAPGWDKIEALVAADTSPDGIDPLEKLAARQPIDMDAMRQRLDKAHDAAKAFARKNNPPWAQF